MTKKSDTFEIAEMGDVVLQSGATLRGAKLAYKTHGTLNAARDRGTNIAGAKPGLRGCHEALRSAVRRALDVARGNHPQLRGPVGAGHRCAEPLEGPGARQDADGRAVCGIWRCLFVCPGARRRADR